MIYSICGHNHSNRDICVKIWQLLDVWYNNLQSVMPNGVPNNIKDAKELYSNDIQYVTFNLEYNLQNQNSQWQKRSFAAKLKQIVCIMTGCSMEQLEDNDFKNTKVPEWLEFYKITYRYSSLTITDDAFVICGDNIHNKLSDLRKNPLISNVEYGRYTATYRELLQYLGIEVFRSQISSDIHINMLFDSYTCQLKGDDFANCCIDEIEGKKECNHFPNWLISDVRFLNEAKAIKDRGGKIIKIKSPVNDVGNHQSETELEQIEADYIINNNGTIENLIRDIESIMIAEKIIKI